MKKLNLQFLTLLAFSALFFVACSKSSSSGPSGSAGSGLTATSTADAQADDIYNNVFDNVSGVNSNQGLGTGVGATQASAPVNGTVHGEQLSGGVLDTTIVRGCATITIDSTNGYPVTVTIDFGTGCLGKDGRNRMGQIITVFSGPLSVVGSTATTTFNGYYVDSTLVGGTHIITNASVGNTNIYTVQVVNGMLTEPSGNYTSWNKTKTWTQIAGANTPHYLLDDVFSITGGSTGTTVNGDSTYQWTGSINPSAPLIRDLDCRWIVQGEKTMTWNSITAVLDYGKGACDNLATLTIDGRTFNIVLR